MHKEMTAQEERFWMHALSKDPVVGSYLRNQARHGVDVMKQARNMLVSPCCEAAALHHQGGILCAACGKWSPKGSTHKVIDHIRGGYYR